MRNIVTTHAGLTNTATNSSTTNVDPRYLAAEETQRNATAEHAANEVLIATLIASVESAKQAARTRQQDNDRAHRFTPFAWDLKYLCYISPAWRALPP